MRRYKHSLPLQSKIFRLILLTVVLLLLLSIVIIFIKLHTLEKFSYVNNNNGNAEIIIIDSKHETISKILIDKDFKLQSSRNFGEYKLSSLWILAKKEKIQGQLVAESIVKNFGIPVYLWKDGKQSNLSFMQKLKSSLFERKINNYSYVLRSFSTPDTVLINFIEPEISEISPKLKIEDLTGTNKVAEKMVQILGIFGVKTTLYLKGYNENLDCQVGGKNEKLVNLTANLFSCSTELNDEEFDLKIRIGKVFANRF